MNDPSLNPILKPLGDMPENVLFIVPLIDIVVKEQLQFIERLNSELRNGDGNADRRFETMIFEKGFHGWLECEFTFFDTSACSLLFVVPRGVIDEQERTQAYDAAIEFISQTHKRYR